MPETRAPTIEDISPTTRRSVASTSPSATAISLAMDGSTKRENSSGLDTAARILCPEKRLIRQPMAEVSESARDPKHKLHIKSPQTAKSPINMGFPNESFIE